jgi:hypothetical protein
MIKAVNVASAHQERPVSVVFVGAKDCHSQVNPEMIARKFLCGIETAQKILTLTTQRGVRQAIHPLSQRYCVNHSNLNRRRSNDTFYIG